MVRSFCAWLGVFACGGMLASSIASASDFSQRLAKWNVGPVNGGEVRPVAYDEPVETPVVQAEPATRGADVQAVAPGEPVLPPSVWQEMAFGQYHGGYGPPACASCGPVGCAGCGSCGECCGPAACGQGCCGMPMCWVRADLFLGWRKGQPLHPLVTTDPVSESSDTAGILPNATLLFGGDYEYSRMQAGGRIDFGWWMDPNQCWGYGNRFFGLGRDNLSFQSNNLENPILAIPFFNISDNQNDALLIAYPGLRSGSVDITGSSEVLVNDVYARLLFCQGCYGRIDLLTGYTFSRYNENLYMLSNSVVTGGTETVGTELTVFDQFIAHNEFHGAMLGLSAVRDCGGCWTLSALAKISIGNMHETAEINGFTEISVPGQPSQTTPGGLFTDPDTNIGTFSRNQFTAITELGLTLGYKIAPCTQLTVGYTLLYWNDAVRPGTLVDPQVGSSSTAGNHPRFQFSRDDFWVQGINLGLSKEF